MQRVGEVTLNVFCQKCESYEEVVFTSDQWEQNVWVDNWEQVDNSCIPVVEVTCPNCGHLEDVNLY